MDQQLMLTILAGTSKEPVTKDKFIEFAKTVTFDYENIAFYDAVVTFSTKYEQFHKKVFPDKPVTDVQRAHVITESGKGTASRPSTSKTTSLSSHNPTEASESSNVIISVEPKTQVLGNWDRIDPKFPSLLTKECKTEHDLQEFARQACFEISKEFILEGSEQEVNISGEAKKMIKKRVEEGKDLHPGIFKKALQEVLLNIATNIVPRFKKQQVLTNIGKGEIKVRYLSFAIFLIIFAVIVALLWTIGYNASSLFRLVTFIPLVPMYMGWIQARTKFCVTHGGKGTSNFSPAVKDALQIFIETKDTCARVSAKEYANMLTRRGYILSAATVAVLLAIPPYNYP
ncbi:hypothetical protein EDD86DRAFT_197795 [Gorgonomyces haynaldii]|nr:hypothetical protein EDD86DRAFT_197795 [Gorgonomyces haynaldii]